MSILETNFFILLFAVHGGAADKYTNGDITIKLLRDNITVIIIIISYTDIRYIHNSAAAYGLFNFVLL